MHEKKPKVPHPQLTVQRLTIPSNSNIKGIAHLHRDNTKESLILLFEFFLVKDLHANNALIRHFTVERQEKGNKNVDKEYLKKLDKIDESSRKRRCRDIYAYTSKLSFQ
jgi:hypothetical protein